MRRSQTRSQPQSPKKFERKPTHVNTELGQEAIRLLQETADETIEDKTPQKFIVDIIECMNKTVYTSPHVYTEEESITLHEIPKTKHLTFAYDYITRCIPDTNPLKAAVLRYMDIYGYHHEYADEYEYMPKLGYIQDLLNDVGVNSNKFILTSKSFDSNSGHKLAAQAFSRVGLNIPIIIFEYCMLLTCLLSEKTTHTDDDRRFLKLINHAVEYMSVKQMSIIYIFGPIFRIIATTFSGTILANYPSVDNEHNIFTRDYTMLCFNEIPMFGDIRLSSDPRDINSFISVSPRSIVNIDAQTSDLKYFNIMAPNEFILTATKEAHAFQHTYDTRKNADVKELLALIWQYDLLWKIAELPVTGGSRVRTTPVRSVAYTKNDALDRLISLINDASYTGTIPDKQLVLMYKSEETQQIQYDVASFIP